LAARNIRFRINNLHQTIENKGNIVSKKLCSEIDSSYNECMETNMTPDKNGWLPIETCPKERNFICDLWVISFGKGVRFTEAMWKEIPCHEHGGLWYIFNQESGWWDIEINSIFNITHWRMIPEGPENNVA